MSIEQSTSFTKLIGSRKVCVLNLDSKPYREDFKGEIITIPPNGKREIYFPFWKASEFKSSCIAPPIADITGDAIRGGMVKMIQVVELNEEERKKFGELTQEDIQKEVALGEAKKALTCLECGFEAKSNAGLLVHQSSKHGSTSDSISI